MPGLLSKERIVAPPGFNRWRVPPASMAIHLCIGSVYAWSIFNPALIKVRGVVTSAAGDWSLRQVVWIFTVAIVITGLAAAFAGKWLEKVGPRKVGVVAALSWGGGLMIGAVGIWLHELWILYFGYGVLGGIGVGLGYVSPVSTLIRWFPDRRGMAAGLAIMGFGGGAIVGAPLNEFLLEHFYQAPEYLGPVDKVELITEAHHRSALVSGERREVAVVAANEVGQMTVPGPAGVYLIGTGCSGVAETFFVLGAGYLVIMLGAAFLFRIPAPGWSPEGWTPDAAAKSARKMISQHHVTVDGALATPQFYLLWIMLCFNVTAGIAVLGVAKTMMTEIFGVALPSIVDASFAATYVVMTSVFNMAGRIFWASASDYLGRKSTYAIFFVLGSLLYLTIPYCAVQMSASPSVVWLVVFYAVTMLIFTMYGGGFATIPAYLADLFGTRYVGGIHGRLLTAWSVAGALGPQALTWLRERALTRAMHDVAAVVEPAAFVARFGEPREELANLIANKTVTLAKLMELAPAGTANPSSTLYNSTMYLMAGLLVVALIANSFVRPVAAKHWEQE